MARTHARIHVRMRARTRAMLGWWILVNWEFLRNSQGHGSTALLEDSWLGCVLGRWDLCFFVVPRSACSGRLPLRAAWGQRLGQVDSLLRVGLAKAPRRPPWSERGLLEFLALEVLELFELV